MPELRLILASASPRRQELLRDAGYRFIVSPADIDESIYPPNLSPGQVAVYLSEQKARTAARSYPSDVILAADTVVAMGGELFGKPADREDARRMLGRLSGSVHGVLTGVTVACPATGFWRTRLAESAVHMRPLTAAELDSYLDTNQWQGKAGGYGIQDPDPFVTRSTGSLTNIVGLPMQETAELLAEAGIHAPGKSTLGS
jgi:septum formation protein